MPEKKSIRVGLLGCGTVGTGVLRILRDNAADIEARLGVPVEVVRIAVADRTKQRDEVVPAPLLTEAASQVIGDPTIDVIAEVIGGYEPARTHLLSALAEGKHVVTANKALLARHGAELFRAGDAAGRDLIFEASVGGGIPVIRTLREGLASEHIDAIRAIINGTSNYILTEMADGAAYRDALESAQELGYAEADPTMDVGGVDAAQKLSILISLCWGAQISFEDIPTQGLDTASQIDMAYAEAFGYTIKPLAVARAHADGIEARVAPALVDARAMLGSVQGAFNAVHIESDALGPVLLYGQGAGMLPTAAAVVSDIIELGRSILGGASGRLPHMAFHEALVRPLALRPAGDSECPFYLRFGVADEPGVLASLSGALGARGVSISRMVQETAEGTDHVDVVMLSHVAREGDVVAALEAIDTMDCVRHPSRFLRIEVPA
ncbi:MAG: homoserine dehydrogenase [Myxococcota bacterium]|nr:homoserine dehydrogenase [Myxococcota bacterium]